MNDRDSCNFDLSTAHGILKDGTLFIYFFAFILKFARFEIVLNECKSQIQSVSLN